MELTPAHRRAMRRLAIDRAAAEAVAALAAVGIRGHLLKGPTFTELLYDRGEERHYTDVDLLVAPSDELRASEVLRGLGYEAVFSRWETDHAWAHQREHDGVWVDLHRTLPWCSQPAAVVHAELTADDEVLELAGEAVPVLGPTARRLHAAVHAGCNGPDNARSIDDLRRAIHRSELAAWDDVAGLARRVGVEVGLATGLRLLDDGEALLERLGLGGVSLRHGRGDVALVGGLDRWSDADLTGRVRLLLALLLPSRGQLQVRFPWSVRSTGRRVAAAALWPFWLLLAVPRAVLARRRRTRDTSHR